MRLIDVGAGLLHLGRKSGDVLGVATSDNDFAVRDGAGQHERSSFNTVRNNGVVCTVKFFDALHFDGGGAGAVDFRAHGDKEVGQILHFGFAGGIVDGGFAFG